ncbi:MAG: TonB-dependent receptor [Bacteroidota bacterium]|nr:TonB-dependent receptor [Candidatus Kapabacteria bacterium]MDW8219779.1 TonB-dependent receptor [Bacteroidota bacterium]
MQTAATTFLRFYAMLALMLMTSTALAIAAGRVVGKVTDEDTNAPLGGVSIKIKVGSKVLGAFTAKDGTYEIRNVPAGSYEITASYIGFKTKTLKVTVVDDAEARVDFQMQLDLLLLEEAVVIGYGTKQKKDVTGAVSRVNANEIANLPVPSIDQALQGKAAGVQIITANGATPGAAVTVRIRGVGSIASATEPLYVVDGIPITSGDFAGMNGAAGNGYNANALVDLNPQDIESIDVLKDAAATAIYGARGANGVVIITTKRGQAGTTKFNVNLTTGFTGPTNIVRVLNRDEFVELYTEAWNNDIRRGLVSGPVRWPGNVNVMDPRNNTDWLSLVLQTGRLNEASVSASGGNEKTKFFTGLTYRDETTYVIGNRLERTSGRLNIDHNATDALTIGVSVGVARTVQNKFPEAWGGGLGWAQSGALPIFPVRNPDGTFFRARDFWVNPIARFENTRFNTNTLRTLAGLYGELRILPELSFRSEASVDLMNQIEDFYQGAAIRGERDDAGNFVAYAEQRRVQVINWNTNNYFTYNTKIADDHDIQATLGLQAQRSDQSDNGVRGQRGFANPYLTLPGNAVLTQGYTVYNYFSFLSYFGRLSYKFKDRYIVGATANYNGSSRFGLNNQFGFFPAFSAAWVISEEPFMKDNGIISFLKLRGSYGFTGNAEIGNYQWRGLYSPSGNYDGRAAIRPSQLPNFDLTWERARQLDAALEWALLDGRLQGAVGYYNRESYDMLLPVTVPASLGFNSVLRNVGSITNWGMEFTLTSHNLTGELTWQTDLNLAFNRNTINDLGGLPDGSIGGQGETRALVGFPVGTFFINRFARINDRTQELEVVRRRPGNTVTYSDLRKNPNDPRLQQFDRVRVTVRGGEPLFYNLNGDLTDRYTVDDRVPLGQPYPTLFGGLTNTFRYKGLELNFTFNFAFGNQIYDDAAKWTAFGTFGALGTLNQRRDVTLTRWRQEGDQTTIPALTTQGIYNDFNTDRHLFRGDFVRLRSLTLAYNLPSEWLSGIGLQSVRIAINGFNLWTLTSFPYWDPEVVRDLSGAQDRNFSQGVTFLAPPQARGVNVNLNIGF